MQRILSTFLGGIGLFVVCTAMAVTPDSHSTAPAMPSGSPQVEASGQTWNLQNADIRGVIQTISALTGKSFIVDPRVSGRITFVSQKPMSNDAMYQVFLSLLQVLNYTVIPSGDYYKIVPAMYAKEYGGALATHQAPGQGDEVVVRLIPVNHTSAMQLVPILRPLMHNWGSVSAYGPSNSLILVGSAQNVQRVIRMVHDMDQDNASQISFIALRFADAKKIADALNQLQMQDRSLGKAANFSLVADSQSNSILLSANRANTLFLRNLIDRMDSPGANSQGDTLVVHLNYQSAKKLAPILEKIGQGTLNEKPGKDKTAGSAIGVSVQAETTENALIIHAPKRILESLKQVVAKLDKRPGQVLVEAIVVKIDEALLDRLGVVWGSVDSSGTATGFASSDGRVNNSVALRINRGVGFIKNGDLQALVQALRSDSATEILSTPSIVVMNNEEASIDDGKNIGMLNREYSTNTTSTQNSVTPFNTYERKDVTLSLKVTPQISPNRMLRLKVAQRDDSLAASSSSTSTNPVIETSKITTNVLVKSGDILVLGGLVKHNQIRSVSKVPILGDIPIVGQLFRYKSNQIEKKDLMVFLRPVILDRKGQAQRETEKRYRYVRQEQQAVRGGRRVTQTQMGTLPPYHHGKPVFLPAPKDSVPSKATEKR